MKTSPLLVLALTAALPLAALRPAAAATPDTSSASPQPNIVAQATGAKDPFVLSFLDDANNNVKTDDPQAQKIHDAFANIQYLVTDQNRLLIGQLSGQNFSALLPAGIALDVNNGKGYYIVHLRNNLTFLDGTIIRFSDQPNQGFARLVLTLQDGKGNSASNYIEQPLVWAGNQPNSTPSTPSNPFGF